MAPLQSTQIQRTMLLTGASRGIGRATVKRFSSAGWRVITCSRRAFPEGCPWIAGPQDLQIDLADPADTRRAIAGVREGLADGRLDALVINAEISRKGANGSRLGFFETELVDWQRIFQVNFFAPMILALGLIAEPRSICLNAISSGEIDTAILSPGMDKIVAKILLRSLGSHEELAKAIYFLCSDQPRHVHGADIHFNSGQQV